MDNIPTLLSISILLHSARPSYAVPQPQVGPDSNTSKELMKMAAHQVVHWLCVDNVCGPFISWSYLDKSGVIKWYVDCAFTCQSTTRLFSALLPDQKFILLSALYTAHLMYNYAGMNTMYIPYQCGTIADWLLDMVDIININIQ